MGLSLIIPHFTVESFAWYRFWIRPFVGINVPQDGAGEWTKPTSKSKTSGNICTGQSIRQASAALRFFRKTIRHHGEPEVVTIDKSGANTAALTTLNADKPDEETMTIRQSMYLNNRVEQDHRNIKRRIRPMLGLKSFRRAQTILAGIELLHMIRKGQYQHPAGDGMSPAEQFYLLAA